MTTFIAAVWWCTGIKSKYNTPENAMLARKIIEDSPWKDNLRVVEDDECYYIQIIPNFGESNHIPNHGIKNLGNLFTRLIEANVEINIFLYDDEGEKLYNYIFDREKRIISVYEQGAGIVCDIPHVSEPKEILGLPTNIVQSIPQPKPLYTSPTN